MISSSNLKSRFESNGLMKNSPEFPYPIQPDCKSIMEPQIKSRDELLSNSDISIHKVNSNQLEQKTSLHSSKSEKNAIKQHLLFSEIGSVQAKLQLPTNLMKWSVYTLIFMSLILLPVQITFFSCQLVLLHIIITIFRMIQYLNHIKLSHFSADLSKFVVQIVITLLSVLCSWLGFTIYLISYTNIIQLIYSSIKRSIICLLPWCSQILLIIMRLLFLVHLLNCYVSQCLRNKQESDQLNYFECLHITLCLIANVYIPSVEITESLQLVTIVSYFYIIYLLLKIQLRKNDISIYFLEKQEISLSLRFKIFDELSSNESQKITRQLSSTLINSIHQEQCQQFIKSNFESYDLIEQITQMCEVVDFESGQKIVELNRQDDCSLYFILKGQLRVMLNNYSFKTLSQKSTFGQLSFYTQQGRTATVICATNCRVIKLPRARILSILQNKDLERFHLIKDQILYCQQLPFQMQCYNCEESTHVILTCPQIQYSMQNKRIIELYNQSIIQARSYYCRNSKKKVKILINSHHSEQFKLKLQQILSSKDAHQSQNTLNSSEIQSSSDNQRFQRDNFVSGSYHESISPTINGDQLFVEQYGNIQGMLLSSDRVFSLQDMQKHPKTIQEESLQSSQSSIQDLQAEVQVPRQTKVKSKQIGLKSRTQSLQKEQVSDSSLNLSPIFKGEQSNPSTNFIPIQSKRGIPLKSQSSNPVKTDSAYRSGLSSFQVFSGNDNLMVFDHFVKVEIDQMHIFEIYYPLHNYDKILVEHYL